MIGGAKCHNETRSTDRTKKETLIFKYHILLIAPSQETRGGVTDFCKMLTSHLGTDFQVFYLAVGSRSEAESLVTRGAHFCRAMFCLIQKLRKQTFDAVHINPSFRIYSLVRDSIFLVLISLFHLSERTIVFFHGWDEEIAAKLRETFFWGKLFKRIYQQTGIICVLYEKCREQLIDLGIDAKKIRIMSTMYEDIGRDENAQKRRSNGTIHILFMSRFVKEKGLYIAAEVIKLLVEHGHTKFKSIFAGDGPEYGGLNRYVIEHKLDKFVEMPGYVVDEAKTQILEKSDIFLYPTYGEGCPIVILEAMGAGLAIVSAPVGAIPNIVADSINGFLVPGRNAIDYLSAIKRLIEDDELREKIQNINRKHAKENYEASVVTRKVELIYKSILRQDAA